VPHKITLIPGDGIGPEVADATVEILDATGVHIEWERMPAGMSAIEAGLDALPEETVDSIRANGIALKGPTTTPIGEGHTSANVLMRRTLDLYASIRPCRTLPGVPSRYEDVDLVVFRENTEGLYAGMENPIAKGVVVSIKVVTEEASRRIAKAAFDYAIRHNRKRVTAVHKANIMKLGDGSFLRAVREVADTYPSITYDEAIIDACCMSLVQNPSQYDILLMENLYGDIVSDLCAGLVGGLGVVPGANIGFDAAIFEAVHGTAPDIAGKGLANPIALLKSSVLMLSHMGELSAAEKLEAAVNKVLAEGKVRTGDLGGTATTREMTDAIIAEVQA